MRFGRRPNTFGPKHCSTFREGSRRFPHVAADGLEQVHECQTPFFLTTGVDSEGRVHLFFDAPPESPTVRGFAGILLEGLEGETVQAVLAVPDDFFHGMGWKRS